MFWQVGALGVNIIPVGKGKESESQCIRERWRMTGAQLGIRPGLQSKSVMGPSSLSPTISQKDLGISLPSITDTHLYSIKMTLNELTGSHTYMWERDSFVFPSLLISVSFTGLSCYFFMCVWLLYSHFLFLISTCRSQENTQYLQREKCVQKWPLCCRDYLKELEAIRATFTQQFEVISQLRSFHPQLKMDWPLLGDILGQRNEGQFSYYTRLFWIMYILYVCVARWVIRILN